MGRGHCWLWFMTTLDVVTLLRLCRLRVKGERRLGAEGMWRWDEVTTATEIVSPGRKTEFTRFTLRTKLFGIMNLLMIMLLNNVFVQ